MGTELGGRAIAQITVSHTVDVDAFTGTAQLRVDVPCTPGRAGFGPALALTHAPSPANSPFGIGWSLSGWPAIGIDTRKRAPQWDGRDDLQWGGDELVALMERSAGVWTPRARVDGAWQITTYRSRRGGRKARIERWLDGASGRVHFRTWEAGGVITIYGARPAAAARIADPDDEARTFAWLPELQLDRYGNAIWFEYAAETIDGVDRSAPFEPRQPTTAQRYLKRIRYTNGTPLALSNELIAGTLPPALRWHMQVVIDYGDHGDTEDRPATEPDRPWPARRDPFTSCRPGFPVRTHRLARRILWAHDFDELGPGPTVVGALSLEHDERTDGSTIVAIREQGYRRNGTGVATRAVPALRMKYAPTLPETAFVVPSRTIENVSAGAGAHRFVDLYGEGLPGILTETNRTWFYKPNLGGGTFGAQVAVAERPAVELDTFTLGDLDGNGDLDLSQLGGRSAGRFEHARETTRWCEFRPFAAFPHVEAFGGRAQWVDLNGDGRPDVVIAKLDALVWFPSEDDGRFGAPIEVPLPAGASSAPMVGADPSLRLFFADMNGDGLADLVRVDNGSVVYWPSLGNGRFGDAVVMEDVPWFSDSDLDAGRLRFVDLDGSGTTDLVFLGNGEVTCWINAAGNRFVPGHRLSGLPRFDNVSGVSVLDFLGDGRPCLVWTNPLPGHEPIAYLPLTTALRPRLLVEVDDSRGKQVRLAYASSAAHYLRAREMGAAWSTRLPDHVVVVDQLEIVDAIGGNRTVRRYEYHEGYFDGDEREQRGFGRVDVYDATAGDAAPPGAPAFSTPSLVRTWFHLGTPMWNHHRPTETYAGDRGWLPPHVIEREAELGPGDVDDGLRGLAGQVIRREVWSVIDHHRLAEHPISVQRRCLALRLAQPRSGSVEPAFEAIGVEDLVEVYEQQPDEPRVTHEIVIEVDAFGSPCRTASIGYPRQSPPRPGDPASQTRLHLVVEDTIALHLDEPSRFELDIPIEGARYELSGVRPGTSGRIERDQLRSPTVAQALATPIGHHETLADGVAPAARLLARDRSYYWDTARNAAAPLGSVGATTLVHHEEAACFAPAHVAAVFGERADDGRLAALGYVQRDGLWWTADPTHEFALASAFSQRIATVRDDGARTELSYDAYALAIVAGVDALGNRTVSTIDYHDLLSVRIEDPNGAVTEVERDPLGVAISATRYGTVEGEPWGFAPLAFAPTPAPTLAAALAEPIAALGGVARRVWYDVDAWARDGTPTTVLTLVRTELVHDGDGNSPDVANAISVGVAYVDGFGRTLQTKTRVEPGDAIQRDLQDVVVVDSGGRPVLAPAVERWRSSGHIVYDGEQRPGRVYEPFFTPTAAFEGDEVLRRFGTSTLTRYDAVSRVIARDLPNGTFTTATYRPWELELADPNDTVLDSTYRALRESLPADAPERQALEHARRHANTTRVAYLDPLGRECGSLARGEPGTADRRTELRTDVDGQPREVVDPRGLVAIGYTRDMLGRTLQESSIDAGELWMLPDARGRAVWTWNPRGFEVERGFDRADRSTFVHVRGGDGPSPLDHRVEESHYGEDLGDRADAARRNLLGRRLAQRDGAGEASIDRYDPDGHPLAGRRRLRDDGDGSDPDWRAPIDFLPDEFVTTSRYDGLGRPRTDTLPDGTRRDYEYLASGTLQRIRVTTPDGTLTDHAILDDAVVNARGQRAHLMLGNGVEIDYGYERDTFRLAEQLATRGTQKLQNLRYSYDPAGNLVRLEDAAQEGPGAVITGAAVGARRDFTYDAHYRLRTATGRVHQSLLQHDYVPGVGFKQSRHLSLDNGAAIERYTRSYELDASGNLTSIQHRGDTRAWTTELWVDPASNRSIPSHDHNNIPIATPGSRFDATGNLREVAHLRRVDWSWRGAITRAVVIARPGGTDDAERYVYAADGHRVRKIATRVVQGGQVEVTEKIYLGDQELRRVSRDGVVILERWTTHVGDGAQRLALIHRWTRDTLSRETVDVNRSRIHYQLETHQRSSALELDDSGRIISYEEYFPYGGTSLIAGDAAREVVLKDYRYSGKECDDATGLYYFGQRYYAPWMARWMSPDPIGAADDLNLYQFVRGDPIGNRDPTGLDTSAKPLPGEIQYVNRTPPTPSTTTEGKQASYRAALGKRARSGFDSLSQADKVTLVTSDTHFLVPANPRSSSLSKWAVITKAQYLNRWLPARQQWAKSHSSHVSVSIFSTSPNRASVGGMGGKEDHPPTLAASGASATAKGDGGNSGGGSKDRGDGGGKGDGKGGDGEGNSADGESTAANQGTHAAGGGKSRNGDGKGGMAGRGAGDDTKLVGVGSELGDLTGGFGGQRGGAAFGVEGGTPYSQGHTPGATGSSLDAGARLEGKGGAHPGSRAATGAGAGVGTSSGAGAGHRSNAGTGTARGPTSGTDTTRGRGPSGGKQDAQGTKREKSAKDVALDVAAILSFTSPGGKPGGHEKGVPGGLGWLNISGGWLQWTFIATSIISFFSMVAGFGNLLAGLVGLVKGLGKLGWKLLTLVPRLLRFGARGLGRLFSAGRSTFTSLRAMFTSRNAYGTSRAFSSGFNHARKDILEAFKRATHTDASRKISVAIESGDLEVQFKNALTKGGTSGSAGKIVVNSSMHMEDVLHTIVHEGQHALDISKGKVPLPGAASAVQLATAELRAWTSAIEFARKNNFVESGLVEMFPKSARDILLDILTSYPYKGGTLNMAVHDEEIFQILQYFRDL